MRAEILAAGGAAAAVFASQNFAGALAAIGGIAVAGACGASDDCVTVAPAGTLVVPKVNLPVDDPNVNDDDDDDPNVNEDDDDVVDDDTAAGVGAGAGAGAEVEVATGPPKVNFGVDGPAATTDAFGNDAA